MKKSIISLLFGLISYWGVSQEVPKKVIVEHTTNSLCSVCASRNPGFYLNYMTQNNGDFIHLSVYPSSPYSACIFNQHDVLANDNRTKFYGIYGSTPRLVINGSPISASSSYSSPTLFDPFINQTSPIGLKLSQQKFGTDSIRVRVVVHTVSAHSLPGQLLFLALAEDIVFYNAPNGENEHYDVFRRALTSTEGLPLTVGPNIGDSVVYTATTAAHPTWDFSRIFAIAILQSEMTKEVTQAEATSPSDNTSVPLGQKKLTMETGVQIFPTITTDWVLIQTRENITAAVSIFSVTGQLVMQSTVQSSGSLNLQSLNSGMYFIRVDSENGTFTQKVMKQ
jgi:hypothetical protein